MVCPITQLGIDSIATHARHLTFGQVRHHMLLSRSHTNRVWVTILFVIVDIMLQDGVDHRVAIPTGRAHFTIAQLDLLGQAPSLVSHGWDVGVPVGGYL